MFSFLLRESAACHDTSQTTSAHPTRKPLIYAIHLPRCYQVGQSFRRCLLKRSVEQNSVAEPLRHLNHEPEDFNKDENSLPSERIPE